GVDVHDPAGVVCIGARIVSRADANWLVVRAGIVPSLATSQWRRAPHQVNVRRIPDMHGICRVHYMLSALAEEILNSFHFRVWRPENPKPALIHCHSPSVAPTSALPWAPDRVGGSGERRESQERVGQVRAGESALRVTVDICEALCWRPVLHELTNLLRGPRLADHLHAAVGPRKPISHETQVFSRARFGEFVHLHSPHVPSPDARGQLQFRCGAKHRPRLFHVLQELPFREPQEACASLHAPAHESVGVDTGAFAAVGGAEAMVGGARKYEVRRNDPPSGAVADKPSGAESLPVAKDERPAGIRAGHFSQRAKSKPAQACELADHLADRTGREKLARRSPVAGVTGPMVVDADTAH